MPRDVTFSVSKKGAEKMEVRWSAPESLDDPRWNDVVSNPATDINSAAVRNIIISIQSAARSRMDSGPEAVQAFVDQFKTGVRQPGGSRSRPTLSAAASKDLKFTPAQLAALAESGMNVEALAG